VAASNQQPPNPTNAKGDPGKDAERRRGIALAYAHLATPSKMKSEGPATIGFAAMHRLSVQQR
jgi:hypothetical protein